MGKSFLSGNRMDVLLLSGKQKEKRLPVTEETQLAILRAAASVK